MSETKVGDTICDSNNSIQTPLPGFKPSKPVVFCGLFPVDSSEYQKLKDGLAKLKLNDASFSYEPESSGALGLGFRCGFLGLLHLEIITERLEREFDVNLKQLHSVFIKFIKSKVQLWICKILQTCLTHLKL